MPPPPLSVPPGRHHAGGVVLFDDYALLLGRTRTPSAADNTIQLLDSPRSARSPSCDAYVMDAGTPNDTTAPLDDEHAPGPLRIEPGALRPGGAVALWSRQHIGLLAAWFVAGVFYAALEPLSQALLGDSLGATAAQLDAATALNTIPWLFKFVAGFATDCVPLARRRRKPYIVLGWGAFALFMAAMACVDLPVAPHADDEAPDARVPAFALALATGSLAHLLAAAALEGVMVEWAQRESERARGRTQCLCLIARFTGQFVGVLALSLALDRGDGVVPLRAVFLALAALAVSGVGFALAWLEEPAIAYTAPRLSRHARRLWGVMQRRATSLVAVAGFAMRVGTTFEVVEWLDVRELWLHASPAAILASDAALELGRAAAAGAFLAWLRNVDWRATLAGSLVASLVLAPPADLAVTFAAWRSLALFLAERHATAFLDALRFVLRAVLVVEVAEPAYEAVTYGLLTTAFNLGDTVMVAAQQAAAARFDPAETDLVSDTRAVRWHVARQYLAKYALWLATLLLVPPLLPRQKRHVRALARLAPASLVAPIALCAAFSLLFALALAATLVALLRTTWF